MTLELPKAALSFNAPVIQDNPTGWGPCELPDQFCDMPYQPFSKGDRLGKIIDWTGAAPPFQEQKNSSKYASQFGSGSQYAYYHDEDESTFHLVDKARVQKPPHQRCRFRNNQKNMRGRGGHALQQDRFSASAKIKVKSRRICWKNGTRHAALSVEPAPIAADPRPVEVGVAPRPVHAPPVPEVFGGIYRVRVDLLPKDVLTTLDEPRPNLIGIHGAGICGGVCGTCQP